jgi:hypothetical protein
VLNPAAALFALLLVAVPAAVPAAAAAASGAGAADASASSTPAADQASPAAGSATAAGTAIEAAAAQGGSAAAGGIRVGAAFVRALPPGQPTTAAFLHVTNDSARARRLTGARCAAAGRIEIHEHVHAGAGMMMRSRADVPLPPGQRVEFAPGGMHLMLIDLTAPLAAGSTLPITLLFDDGVALTVPFHVRSVLDEP